MNLPHLFPLEISRNNKIIIWVFLYRKENPERGKQRHRHPFKRERIRVPPNPKSKFTDTQTVQNSQNADLGWQIAVTFKSTEKQTHLQTTRNAGIQLKYHQNPRKPKLRIAK
eukprot:TRINITY_DN11446_c1_g1_i2.p1 TRINITY_DN11446_c1_g1~~TRINITY_DN11446_c1_g1_i2.p1  ORF type:complete len:112 (+),score=6.87 TRINITY_DN11446_c1_g1_i2:161-496(+)